MKPTPSGRVVAKVYCANCGDWLAFYVHHSVDGFGLQTAEELVRSLDPRFAEHGAPRVAPAHNVVTYRYADLPEVIEIKCSCGRRTLPRHLLDDAERRGRRDAGRPQKFAV